MAADLSVDGVPVGATELIYRVGPEIDAEQIGEVYRSVGWGDLAADAELLARGLRGATLVVSAWDGARAVGVARMLSDGAFQAYIMGVAVRPEYGNRGVGTRLVTMLLDSAPALHFHLRTSTRRFAFYERLGFERHDTAMECPPTIGPRARPSWDGARAGGSFGSRQPFEMPTDKER